MRRCACAVVPLRVKGSTPREVTEADSATRGLLKSHAATPSSPLPTYLTAVPVKRRLTFPSELSVQRKTPAEAAGRLGSSQKKLQVRRVITRRTGRTQRPHRGDACGYWTAWIPTLFCCGGLCYMPKLGKQTAARQSSARRFTVFATVIGE